MVKLSDVQLLLVFAVLSLLLGFFFFYDTKNGTNANGEKIKNDTAAGYILGFLRNLVPTGEEAVAGKAGAAEEILSGKAPPFNLDPSSADASVAFGVICWVVAVVLLVVACCNACNGGNGNSGDGNSFRGR